VHSFVLIDRLIDRCAPFRPHLLDFLISLHQQSSLAWLQRNSAKSAEKALLLNLFYLNVDVPAGRIRWHTFRRRPPFPACLIARLDDDWAESTDIYISCFDCNLKVFHNDCSTFARGLAEHLAGKDLPKLDTLSLTKSSFSSGTSVPLPDILDW
jgi:hypothetical protein